MIRVNILFLILMAVAVVSGRASFAQDPREREEGTRISIDGTVDSVTPGGFLLNYGDGTIKVEMDDPNEVADAYNLIAGDTVTVYGRIEDDTFDTATINASSVFIEGIGTFFYGEDESLDETGFLNYRPPEKELDTVLNGFVSSVSKDTFTLDTGARELLVETAEMPNDPLDDIGYQKLEVGDRVTVTGDMDTDFIEGRVLEAETVITLHGYNVDAD